MEKLDLQRIAQDVEQRAVRQLRIGKMVFLGVSVLMFVLFNIIAWAMFFPQATPELSEQARTAAGAGMFMLSMGWLVSIIYAFLSFFFDSKAALNQTRGQLMGQAINKELVRLGLSAAEIEMEKPKRVEATAVRLTDDGELAEDVETPSHKSTAQQN